MLGLAHEQSTDLSQIQKLTLTPKMTLAFKVLQMSSFDLRAEINNQVDNNLMLKIDDGLVFERSSTDDDNAFTEHESYLTDIPLNMPCDSEWDDIYNDGTDWKDFENIDPENNPYLEQYIEEYKSLAAHIEDQLQQMNLSETVAELAKNLAYELDEHGFLPLSDSDITNIYHVNSGIITAALEAIQSCHPPGVGARNVRESLLIQLKQLDPRPSTRLFNILHTMILQHFACIYKADVICKIMRISKKEYDRAIKILRTLQPYPSELYQSIEDVQNRTVVPDLYVKEKNGITYIDNTRISNTIPVDINQEYLQLLSNAERIDQLNMKYKLEEARWFLQCLRNRQDTLLKVASIIVAMQQEFFVDGEGAINPLTRKQIAEMLNVSEATISRAVRNKYLHCNRGVYELSYFCSTPVGNKLDDEIGEILSPAAIKNIIREFIAEENPNKPLSDQQISNLLAEKKKCQVARRTVAKYREELGIGTAVTRKKR